MSRTAIVLLVLSLAVAPAAAQVSPELDQKIANMSSQEKADVIILTQGGPNDQAVSAIENAGGNVSNRFSIIDGVSVSLPVQAVDALSSRDFVREIQPDFTVETVLDGSSEYVEATDAWSENATGEDVDVAVVDTGISDSNGFLDVEDQVDFTGEETDDLNGHGTHVAGIVASTDSTYRGVSYDADLFDVKVLESDGSGSGSNVINGIEWAVDNDAEVISLSLGAPVDSCDGTDAISEAVDNAAVQGVTVVVAAGNEGPGDETITIPGCAERALTVGSTDLNDQVSDFSSRGPTADGREKPDVVAPGESITSTWNDGGFESKSGTSMATPHVSGAAAILLAENSSLTPSQVKQTFEDTADDLGYDSKTQGAGLLDVYEAYNQTAGQETSNETNETEQVKQTPEISVVSPENNSESVNDSKGNGTAAELVVNASTEENETINATFYGEGAELEISVDVSGETSYYWRDLEAGTTYTWSAEVTDGENSSSTGELYFTTEVLGNETDGNLSDDNETDGNLTGNRTRPDLPPQASDTARKATSGFFNPTSPFYGFDVAFDNAAVAVGLKSKEEVMKERAQEAKAMEARGNQKAAEKAIKSLRNSAGNSENATKEAQRTLEKAMEDAPEEAKQGLRNALENVEKERQRGKPENPSGKKGADKAPQQRGLEDRGPDGENQQDRMERQDRQQQQQQQRNREEGAQAGEKQQRDRMEAAPGKGGNNSGSETGQRGQAETPENQKPSRSDSEEKSSQDETRPGQTREKQQPEDKSSGEMSEDQQDQTSGSDNQPDQDQQQGTSGNDGSDSTGQQDSTGSQNDNTESSQQETTGSQDQGSQDQSGQTQNQNNQDSQHDSTDGHDHEHSQNDGSDKGSTSGDESSPADSSDEGGSSSGKGAPAGPTGMFFSLFF